MILAVGRYLALSVPEEKESTSVHYFSHSYSSHKGLHHVQELESIMTTAIMEDFVPQNTATLSVGINV